MSRSKRLVGLLLMPTSLLGLARTNDCAQHSHLSAANRATFIASMHLCHSPTFKNRKPGHTPGNVKLLLQPRQSRGFSLFGNRQRVKGIYLILLTFRFYPSEQCRTECQCGEWETERAPNKLLRISSGTKACSSWSTNSAERVTQ